MSFQTVTILGNLGRDPELRKTQAGKAVCNFAVAVNEGSGDNKKTTWFSCVAWEKTAELVAEYFKKGNQILCHGQIQTRTYEKDGQDVPVWELIVRQIGFVSSGDRDDDRRSSRGRDDDRSERGRDRDRDDDRRSSRGRDRDDDIDDGPRNRRSGRGRDRDLDDEIPF